MSKDIKGYSIQNGIPTPEHPVEIKSINLFEVNGIQYQDNLPDDSWIGITKEQYCEYLQLKENKNWNELKKWMYGEMKRFEDNPYTRLGIAVFTKVLDKMQEIESGKNE